MLDELSSLDYALILLTVIGVLFPLFFPYLKKLFFKIRWMTSKQHDQIIVGILLIYLDCHWREQFFAWSKESLLMAVYWCLFIDACLLMVKGFGKL